MMVNREFRNMIMIESACIVLGAICGFLFCGKMPGAIILVLGILLMAVFYYYTARRYGEIKRLNTYLDRILAGESDPEIWDYEEGELSILKTNLYKAATILISQRESLRADKTYLADALADISHQLKTPLTSLMVLNDLLRSETDKEKRREFVETESVQLSKMNWLIQTLLKISKLDADVAKLKAENISVEELVKEAILTVEENMTLPILLDKRKPDKALVKELVEKLGLSKRLKHLPNQLSGGQQQRVSIGRALMNHPALLLADEPTGNLDSENSREIVGLLRKFNKENNQTVIIITHDERIALSADRVITIADGQITKDEVRA